MSLVSKYEYLYILFFFLVAFIVYILNVNHLRSHTQQSLFATEKTSISQHISSQKLFGINIAGAEFTNKSSTNVPGNINQDYLYASSVNGYQGFKQASESGLTLIRIPVLWERIQPQAFGTLSDTDIDNLIHMLDDASLNHQKVIIDLHNFGQYYHRSLSKNDSALFSDVWNKLSDRLKNHPSLYGYELMNEPHNLPGGCTTWATIAQGGIDAIRNTDTTHIILVPGYSWQSAKDWKKSSDCLKTIHDPSEKILFSAHQYFDKDFSGQQYDNSVCPDKKYGTKLIQPFLQWLKDTNTKGIFTEYGVPEKRCWLSVLDNFLSTISQSQQVTGGTYWAAGPWWNTYELSLEKNGTMNSPQMSIVKKYPSKN